MHSSFSAVQVSMEIFKHRSFSWVFLVLVFCRVVVAAADPSSESLLELKSKLVDHRNSLKDWVLDGEGDKSSGKVLACSWPGVSCNDNSTTVTGLDLAFKGLSGVMSENQFNLFTDLAYLNFSHNSFSGNFPGGIFNLTKLETIDISMNNFSGPFPPEVSKLQGLVVLDAFSNSFSGSLPVEISKLESLKVLNFAGSYFKGSIPPEYGSLKSIELIHLAGNLLTGAIPPELGQLKTMIHMEIGYNTYEGSIPWQLGNMTELQYLDIAGANLSGWIPKELCNLTNLQSLFLFRNQLTGTLPWEISQITTLTDLDLSDNQIYGPIPESFAQLKSLKLLSLMYNEMSGIVPDVLAELPMLDTLFLWNNFFSGSLPQNLGKYSKLRWLDVSTNYLNGSIPPGICSRGQLSKLIMFSNKFTGGLSPSLSNCSTLIRLRLEDNLFSGDIPLKFSQLPDVSYVDLSRNKFSGGIPNDIYQAQRLQYFNVSDNPELGGEIPSETWSSPLLENFSASACNISGSIPPFVKCKSISVINLKLNNITGSIPTSISSCRVLERLYLGNNAMTGSIPDELTTLPDLSVVDLSHNGFTGTIPEKFTSSPSLVLLNVSFNQISGTIPREKVFQMMGSSAFYGNPELCGEPLKSCSMSKTTSKLTWILLGCAGLVACLAAFALGKYYFRNARKGRWRMVSFTGLPQFTANDVLKSFDSAESMAVIPPSSAAFCKAVLPTGITVSVRTIEWDTRSMKAMLGLISQMGYARHKNLTRLLGFCYNGHQAYLLYDCLSNGNLADKLEMKRDWSAKEKLTIGIARGLCYLHHQCSPAIPHGDLKSTNVVFDDNMEPRLAEFGIKFLRQLNEDPCLEAGEFRTTTKEELSIDVYNFGVVMMEILTNGRLTNPAGESVQRKPREVLLREVYRDNETNSSNTALQERINNFVDVALRCTRTRPTERPSMEDVLKLLSGPKSQRK
uniref:Protein kinase domain-containing protein n=1 Tax=Kalanchoe fedtschenkoi TaxID=63787 RepID=A0A7N0VBF3_KALFE